MSVTSANINDLATFITGSNSRVNTLSTSLTTTATKFNTVIAACGGSESPDTPSLNSLNALLTTWQQNHGFVNSVRNDLIKADNYDANGNGTVSDTVVRQSLIDAGLDKAPDLVVVPAIVLYGEPPYSGFRNDPIGMANGNFLLREGDLQVFGISSVLSVIRAYNSRDSSTGVFGPNWTSLVDVSLTVEHRQVTFRGADGGGAVFQQRDDGTWVGGRRRGLSLTEDEGGWEVVQGHQRTWSFDAEGNLTSLRALAADVVVDRSAASVRFTDRTTARWVTYATDIASGLVTQVESSDGRTVTYDYDASGQIVAVHRGTGVTTYEHDDNGFLSTVTDADGVLVCSNVYDAVGRVLSQVERHGRETNYDYRPDGVAVDTATDGSPPNVMVHDRRGRMTAMIDGLGNTMRVAYDEDDNVVQIVDRTGATTRFAHDDRGNLVLRTDPDGLTQVNTWDAADRLQTETDRGGHTTQFIYDADQRDPSRIVLPDGSEVAMTYDEATGLPASVSDADDVTTTMDWTRDGLLETLTDGLGGTISFEYDAAGRSIGAVGPELVRASVELDPAGRILALHTADGNRLFEYSAAGRMTSGRGEDGSTWTTTLDHAAEIAAVTDSLGPVVSYERDLIGRVTRSANADGAAETYEYDPVGRQCAYIDALGNRTELSFDREGRVLEQTDASGLVESFELDEMGRTIREIRPGGAELIRSYHPNGVLASVTNAAGSTWSYGIDAVGRLTTSTDPLGSTTNFAYTPGGRLAEIRSPLGRTMRGEYDGAGRISRVVEPDGTEIIFERRLDGSLSQITKDGVATSYSYDDAGRIAAVDAQWGVFATQREFGQVTGSQRQGEAAAVFQNDARGLLTRAVDPAGVATEFSHDACGRLVAHATGDSGASYAWDQAGRLESTTDVYGNRTEFGRDARGVIERIVRPDGTATLRQFGPDGKLAGAVDEAGATILTITRDTNGNVATAVTPNAQVSLVQDILGQITSVTTDAGTVTYTRDLDGYLSTLEDSGGYLVNFDHGDAERGPSFELGDGTRLDAPAEPELQRDDACRIVTDEHGRHYNYDVAGRLATATVGDASTRYEYNDLGLLATEHTPAGVRTYSYGLAGELTRQTFEDGTETAFEYDATGRRIAEASSDGSTIAYEWNAFGRMAVITRTGADGTETRQQVDHDPLGRPMRVDEVPILWDSAATGSLLGIGDERYLWWGNQVRVATDPDAAWDRRMSDDPWGNDGGTGVRLGYRGELALDDLLFLGARVYDTKSRTFLSRDPLPSQPGTVSFAGVYSYAWCDPVNMVDPSGEQPISDKEYDEFRKSAGKGMLGRIAEDPMKYIAKAAIVIGSIAVMAVATATLGPVGLIVAGALVGAVAGGLDAAVDGGSWGDIGRAALIGGIMGGLGAGLGVGISKLGSSAATSMSGRILDSAGKNALQEYPMAFAKEGIDAYGPGGDGEFDPEKALIDGTAGTIAGTTGDELQFNRTLNAVNGASAKDLDEVTQIGPVLSNRVVDQRPTTGFNHPNELKDISYIGDIRQGNIVDEMEEASRFSLPLIGTR